MASSTESDAPTSMSGEDARALGMRIHSALKAKGAGAGDMSDLRDAIQGLLGQQDTAKLMRAISTTRTHPDNSSLHAPLQTGRPLLVTPGGPSTHIVTPADSAGSNRLAYQTPYQIPSVRIQCPTDSTVSSNGMPPMGARKPSTSSSARWPMQHPAHQHPRGSAPTAPATPPAYHSSPSGRGGALSPRSASLSISTPSPPKGNSPAQSAASHGPYGRHVPNDPSNPTNHTMPILPAVPGAFAEKEPTEPAASPRQPAGQMHGTIPSVTSMDSDDGPLWLREGAAAPKPSEATVSAAPAILSPPNSPQRQHCEEARPGLTTEHTLPLDENLAVIQLATSLPDESQLQHAPGSRQSTLPGSNATTDDGCGPYVAHSAHTMPSPPAQPSAALPSAVPSGAYVPSAPTDAATHDPASSVQDTGSRSVALPTRQPLRSDQPSRRSPVHRPLAPMNTMQSMETPRQLPQGSPPQQLQSDPSFEGVPAAAPPSPENIVSVDSSAPRQRHHVADEQHHVVDEMVPPPLLVEHHHQHSSAAPSPAGPQYALPSHPPPPWLAQKPQGSNLGPQTSSVSHGPTAQAPYTRASSRQPSRYDNQEGGPHGAGYSRGGGSGGVELHLPRTPQSRRVPSRFEDAANLSPQRRPPTPRGLDVYSPPASLPPRGRRHRPHRDRERRSLSKHVSPQRKQARGAPRDGPPEALPPDLGAFIRSIADTVYDRLRDGPVHGKPHVQKTVAAALMEHLAPHAAPGQAGGGMGSAADGAFGPSTTRRTSPPPPAPSYNDIHRVVSKSVHELHSRGSRPAYPSQAQTGSSSRDPPGYPSLDFLVQSAPSKQRSSFPPDLPAPGVPASQLGYYPSKRTVPPSSAALGTPSVPFPEAVSSAYNPSKAYQSELPVVMPSAALCVAPVNSALRTASGGLEAYSRRGSIGSPTDHFTGLPYRRTHTVESSRVEDTPVGSVDEVPLDGARSGSGAWPTKSQMTATGSGTQGSLLPSKQLSTFHTEEQPLTSSIWKTESETFSKPLHSKAEPVEGVPATMAATVPTTQTTHGPSTHTMPTQTPSSGSSQKTVSQAFQSQPQNVISAVTQSSHTRSAGHPPAAYVTPASQPMTPPKVPTSVHMPASQPDEPMLPMSSELHSAAHQLGRDNTQPLGDAAAAVGAFKVSQPSTFHSVVKDDVPMPNEPAQGVAIPVAPPSAQPPSRVVSFDPSAAGKREIVNDWILQLAGMSPPRRVRSRSGDWYSPGREASRSASRSPSEAPPAARERVKTPVDSIPMPSQPHAGDPIAIGQAVGGGHFGGGQHSLHRPPSGGADPSAPRSMPRSGGKGPSSTLSSPHGQPQPHVFQSRSITPGRRAEGQSASVPVAFRSEGLGTSMETATAHDRIPVTPISDARETGPASEAPTPPRGTAHSGAWPAHPTRRVSPQGVRPIHTQLDSLITELHGKLDGAPHTPRGPLQRSAFTNRSPQARPASHRAKPPSPCGPYMPGASPSRNAAGSPRPPTPTRQANSRQGPYASNSRRDPSPRSALRRSPSAHRPEYKPARASTDRSHDGKRIPAAWQPVPRSVPPTLVQSPPSAYTLHDVPGVTVVRSEPGPRVLGASHEVSDTGPSLRQLMLGY